MHLRAHRRFRLVPNLELSLEDKTSENNTEPSPTLPSTGGSLLVHDKGNFYTLIRNQYTWLFIIKPFHYFMGTDYEQIVKLIKYFGVSCPFFFSISCNLTVLLLGLN